MALAKYFALSNGVQMPVIGFGVYQIPPKDTERCVLEALKAGYRCIDTAAAYGNEAGVGRAIKKSGIPRDQIFVITKLWVTDYGYEKAKEAFEVSLKKLQLDYIDLYLLHQPFNDVYGAWRALEELYEAKKIRAIGVANFYSDRLTDLCLHCRVKPMVNQIECHVFYQRVEERKTMAEYNILPQAWGSFAEGRNDMFNNPILAKIGKAHNKSVAQVILRYEISKGIQVIPKSVNEDRIKQNIDVFDFDLTEDEVKTIEAMDTNKSLFFSHRDPELIKFVCSYKIPQE